jgi:Tol biopolymer transport system component
MKKFTYFTMMMILLSSCAVKIDTISVYVPEEGGINFTKLTDEDKEAIVNPRVQFYAGRMSWWGNPLISLSPDGQSIAYVSLKNGAHNIMVKATNNTSMSTQRTFRKFIRDVCYSPDGESICFSELNEPYSYLYITNAKQGTIIQQISGNSVSDYAPCYSKDGKKIFFARSSQGSYGIWSYEKETNLFTNYCYGMSPHPINDEEFLCTRTNQKGFSDIWLINYVKGTESIVLSLEGQSFSTPSLSPDGKWILCTGNTKHRGKHTQENLDIYVVKSDGSMLTQLTYHQGHDASPVWSKDGKHIYFLSQRGTEKGEWNIWKMNFNL